ncbi:MAG: DNA polymerase III subunit delta [Myxococcota bacterium]
MDVGELIDRARCGEVGPAHVLVGTERFLLERAVARVRAAVLGDGPAGFNDDVFHGRGLSASAVLSAARTLPMMAARRLVLVREVDAMAAAELDALAAYLASPAESTCLLLLADKLDGRTKLAKAAKKHRLLVEAQPLKGGALRAFVDREAKARGHRLSRDAAEALLESSGEDLAALDDALERLSLYVGDGQPIDLAAVEACVLPVRTDSIWALVDGVSARNARRALRAAAALLADREPPLRILAMVARQLRIVARMREALAAGQSPQDAARAAGAPPFKARDLARAARQFDGEALRAAFAAVAEADLLLKGSKRPGDVVLEETVLRLCSAGQPLRA